MAKTTLSRSMLRKRKRAASRRGGRSPKTLKEGIIWFARRHGHAEYRDFLVAATKRREEARITSPPDIPPTGPSALRDYTEDETRAVSRALFQAAGASLSEEQVRAIADTARWVLWWGASFFHQFSLSPRDRMRRIDDTRQAIKKLRAALTELRVENYASLRFLDVEHELYGGDDDLIAGFLKRMHEGEQWLAWLGELTATFAELSKVVNESTEVADKVSRPADFALNFLIDALANDWWQQTGKRPRVWRDKHSEQGHGYSGDFWIFLRATLAPFTERLGEKGSDTALGARAERLTKNLYPATTSEK